MTQPSWRRSELSGDTQYARFHWAKVVGALATLQQNTTGITTTTTMAAAGRNGPLVPHMRPCALRQRVQWMGDNHRVSVCNFWGYWGCAWPSNYSNAVAIGVFWGPYTPSTPQKARCIVDVPCLCLPVVEAAGGHFGRQKAAVTHPWLPHVVTWAVSDGMPLSLASGAMLVVFFYETKMIYCTLTVGIVLRSFIIWSLIIPIFDARLKI